MKEIDINIEGYNVNGICVGCLNYNRKMFYHSDVHLCFKYLADIDVPDGLSIQVCFECLAAVRSTLRFREQITNAFEILHSYSKQYMYLDSPDELSKYASQRLSVTNFDAEEITSHFVWKDENEEPEPQIKTEEPSSDDKVNINLASDLGIDKVENEFLEAELGEEIDANTLLEDHHIEDQVSSEDDVQLSELKAQKKKRGRKKKEKKGKKEKLKDEDLDIKEEFPKRKNKLKNLPENIVELYTMTEDEMWQVRYEDLHSKEFAKLRYKCNDCIIGFNTEKIMTDHLNGKHKPKGADSEQCDVCKAYFLTKDNLSVHRALHLNAFSCMQCGFITCLKLNMLVHVRQHTGTNGFYCKNCDRAFETKSKLSYHKSVCHQEKPQCDCCGKVFANKVTLRSHLKKIPQKPQKDKISIPCKGCGKIFYSKKSYRAHVVIHDGVSYPCSVCGKLFQWKRNLARHMRAHREREAGARHECAQCGVTFSSRDCLKNHHRLSKRHVPDSALNHECNYCGKRFATKWCMVDHIDWDHLKRIKYQCSVCFKAFKTAKIMVAHMNNIHEGKNSKEPEGEHLCEICGKSYKSVKRLKGHVWAMHKNRSDSKSFRCKLCPATFTWQTSIYKHVKVMHTHNHTRHKQQTRSSAVPKKEEGYEGDQNFFQVPLAHPHLVDLHQVQIGTN